MIKIFSVSVLFCEYQLSLDMDSNFGENKSWLTEYWTNNYQTW